MLYTVSDLLNSYAESLRLIAGGGGLARSISEVCILDYELMPGLKNKYQRANFSANDLVLSTFLYARDNPYLITDAIKYLVAKGTSGLVIKNVLHLTIPEQAIRYANVRNFPVFLVTSDDLFFDTVIYSVDQRIQELSSSSFAQSTIDALLRDADDPDAVRRHALMLNPSFKSAFVTLYAELDEPLTLDEFQRLEHEYHKQGLAACEHMLACYDGGVIGVVSADPERVLDLDAVERQFRKAAIFERCGIVPAGIGISARHFTLEELAQSVTEAMQAARFARHRGGATIRFDHLGLFRALLPFVGTDPLRQYAARILDPLSEHDSEHGSALEETLRSFVACGRSVAETARALGQHANTVRYRLEKISTLTGLDYRRADDSDQLALACRIALMDELFPDA